MYISEKLKALWHGCDYNPDQWLEYPQVLKKDIQLMKKAGCNVMSVGIFSWAKLEPQEGVFAFDWLDTVIDRLYENGIYTILATPTGGMPAWLAEKYPEVKRMQEDGVRERFGNRHNHCYSSPVYREKTTIINTKLAQRYANHPGVVMWHISNEYNTGDCHCPLCRENFRKWLQNKYKTIDELNRKWWNSFWSHTYQSFEQIEPPGVHGECSSNPLMLEWQRFKNDLLDDYIQVEIAAVKTGNPHIPVTTNFMRTWNVDYRKLSERMDIISWDNYPLWHSEKTEFVPAVETAMFHALFNSLKKDRPFMMMESSPSATNWQEVSKLRRPGMHCLASMQAVAHGSDTVQYFQWRKSRGQSEQFHGAVVSHDNSEDTRVFREVQTVGEALQNLSEVAGSLTDNKVAILFDFDNYWSLKIAQAYRNIEPDKGYWDVLRKNYGALWQLNIGCDFVFEDEDFSKYKAIVAPMLFMMKKGIKEKIEAFVQNGGIFITGFCSGVVDEYALSFFDEECYPLRKVLGVKAEETDSLYDGETNTVEIGGQHLTAARYCEIAYPEGAQVLGRYEKDFYANMPAITVNTYGKGKAYYIATDFTAEGYTELYGQWLPDLRENCGLSETEENVSVTVRHGKDSDYIFIMNFNTEPKKVSIHAEYSALQGEFDGSTVLPYGVVVLKSRNNTVKS